MIGATVMKQQPPVNDPRYTIGGGNPASLNPTPQPVTPQVPPTGLIGSEQALTGALAGSQQVLGSSLNSGLATLGAGSSTAQTTLRNAAANVSGPRGFGSGMDQIRQPISQGLNTAQSTLSGAVSGVSGPVGFSSGMGQVNQMIGQGVDAIQGYTGFGEDAAQRQAALSGALGPEAQAQAMAAYQNSPYVDQARLNAEQAIMRNAAVTGSLGGGRTLDQLYQNAAGMFMNDYQNQFNNLGQVTNTGLTAAGQIGNLRANQAGIAGQLQQSDIASKTQQQIAAQEIKANLQRQMADAALSSGFQEAGLAGQLQQADIASKTQQQIAAQEIKANLQRQLADAALTSGIQGAGMITQTGGLMSQDIMNTGAMIGAGRTQAGQSIAQNATQAASQISQLLNQQGIALSDMASKDISTITDLLFQSGNLDAQGSQQLAAILANIAGGQASNVLQGNAIIGSANAAGTIGVGNAIQGGITQGIASYQGAAK